jgi:protein-S-isoprenylcysteine O-methyltransferase Ste14
MNSFVSRFYALLTAVLAAAVFAGFLGFEENLWIARTVDRGRRLHWAWAVLIDVALIAFFALQHTVMARQSFKARWRRWLPAVSERNTFVLTTAIALAVLMWCWQPLPGWLWNSEGWAGAGLLGLSFFGWALALYSTLLIDPFDLFGLGFLRGTTEPELQFRTPALYRWVRHPMYSGMILGLWATPAMSCGHLLLAVALTAYIRIGIYYEEKDLVRTFGELYRVYRRDVGMLWPRLGRRAGLPTTV